MKKYYSSVILKDENLKDTFYESLKKSGFDFIRADGEFSFTTFYKEEESRVSFEIKEEETLPLLRFLQKSDLVGFKLDDKFEAYNWDIGYYHTIYGHQIATYCLNDKSIKYSTYHSYKSFDYIKASITMSKEYEFDKTYLKNYLLDLNRYLSVHLNTSSDLRQDAIIIMDSDNLYGYSENQLKLKNGYSDYNSEINLLIRADVLPLVDYKLKEESQRRFKRQTRNKFQLNYFYGDTENDYLNLDYSESTIKFCTRYSDNVKKYYW